MFLLLRCIEFFPYSVFGGMRVLPNNMEKPDSDDISGNNARFYLSDNLYYSKYPHFSQANIISSEAVGRIRRIANSEFRFQNSERGRFPSLREVKRRSNPARIPREIHAVETGTDWIAAGRCPSQ